MSEKYPQYIDKRIIINNLENVKASLTVAYCYSLTDIDDLQFEMRQHIMSTLSVEI